MTEFENFNDILKQNKLNKIDEINEYDLRNVKNTNEILNKNDAEPILNMLNIISPNKDNETSYIDTENRIFDEKFNNNYKRKVSISEVRTNYYSSHTHNSFNKKIICKNFDINRDIMKKKDNHNNINDDINKYNKTAIKKELNNSRVKNNSILNFNFTKTKEEKKKSDYLNYLRCKMHLIVKSKYKPACKIYKYKMKSFNTNIIEKIKSHSYLESKKNIQKKMHFNKINYNNNFNKNNDNNIYLLTDVNEEDKIDFKEIFNKNEQKMIYENYEFFFKKKPNFFKNFEFKNQNKLAYKLNEEDIEQKEKLLFNEYKRKYLKDKKNNISYTESKNSYSSFIEVYNNKCKEKELKKNIRKFARKYSLKTCKNELEKINFDISNNTNTNNSIINSKNNIINNISNISNISNEIYNRKSLSVNMNKKDNSFNSLNFNVNYNDSDNNNKDKIIFPYNTYKTKINSYDSKNNINIHSDIFKDYKENMRLIKKECYNDFSSNLNKENIRKKNSINLKNIEQNAKNYVKSLKYSLNDSLKLPKFNGRKIKKFKEQLRIDLINSNKFSMEKRDYLRSKKMKFVFEKRESFIRKIKENIEENYKKNQGN